MDTKRKRLSKIIIICIIYTLISSVVSLIFILSQGSYVEGSKTIRLHMMNEKNSKSFGKEMRIQNISINNQTIDLKSIQNTSWIWYDEYNYLLYSDGEEDLILHCSEPIKSIHIEYIEQEGSGKVRIYSGIQRLDTLDMYNGTWTDTAFEAKSTELNSYVWLVFNITVIGLSLFWLISSIDQRYKKYGMKGTVEHHNSIGMYDFAKGFGILIVITIHTYGLFIETSNTEFTLSVVSVIEALCYYGVMPMFFMISGFGFREGKILETLKKQWKYLIIPYSCAAGGVILLACINGFLQKESIVSTLQYYGLPFLFFSCPQVKVFGIQFNSIGPIWYCVALFLAWNLLNVIVVYCNKKVVPFVVLIVTSIGYLLSKPVNAFFCLSQSLVAVLFVYIGYRIKKQKLLQKEKAFLPLIYVVIGAIGLLLCWYNGFAGMAGNDWGKSWIGIVASVLTGLALYRLFLISQTSDSKLVSWVSRIGRGSYWIIYIHSVEYLCIPWKKILESVQMNNLWKGIIIFGLRCLFIFVIYEVIKRINRSRRNNS